jgi:sugar O-acyltransferase (sialic acid O-acetyltransferase NeuD family)
MTHRAIVFWGATGQAKVLREALTGTSVRLCALVDQRPISSPFEGIPVLHGEDGLIAWIAQRVDPAPLLCAVAIGGDRGADRLTRLAVMQGLGLAPHSIIHPTAFVAGDASLGDACQVLAQAAVCASAQLGDAVIINTAASVDHDSRVGSGSHIGPGARLAGEVVVGQAAFIGTGAIVLPRVRIGDGAVVGAGAVVLADVPAGVTVAGNPARVISDV